MGIEGIADGIEMCRLVLFMIFFCSLALMIVTNAHLPLDQYVQDLGGEIL
jgi:hypothetical protein